MKNKKIVCHPCLSETPNCSTLFTVVQLQDRRVKIHDEIVSHEGTIVCFRCVASLCLVCLLCIEFFFLLWELPDIFEAHVVCW